MLWKLTLQDMPGIGNKIHELNEGIYKGIPYKVHTISDIKPEDIDKLPRASALALRHLDGYPFTRADLEDFSSRYADLFKPYDKFEIVGSYRRGETEMGDGDVLILNPRNRILVESSNVKVISIGQHKARALFRITSATPESNTGIGRDHANGYKNPHLVQPHSSSDVGKTTDRWIPIDIVFTDTEHYPGALLHYTGSKQFNIHMTVHCAKLGLKLNEYGLWENGKKVNAKSESEIFARVGMKNVPPEQRKDFHEWMLQDRYIKKIEADRRARKANKLRNAKKW